MYKHWMDLPHTIFNVFLLNTMLMILTKEILKENFRCPNQILITSNEAFDIEGPVCGTTVEQNEF